MREVGGVIMATKGRGGGRTPERLVELLNKAVKEISQSAVARETGITQSAVHRYMKGIGEPSQATLEKLAAYFGVSVPWLRGEEDPVGIHQVVDEIREALGVGDDVALADLPGIIRTLRVKYGGLKALLEDDLK